MKTLPVLVGVLILIGAGYFGYTYLKEQPPDFLVDLATRTNPPPELPIGPEAPLTVAEGFEATIYSRDTPSARVIIRDPAGTLLVSLMKDGRVVALPDVDEDNQADETIDILTNLNLPHGLLVTCDDQSNESCTLYVAETGRFVSYDYDLQTFSATNPEVLALFPTDGGHFTRTILLDSSGENIFISVGSSCNVCTETEPYRATVLSYNIESKKVSVLATGLRNTVFLASDPVTGKLWGTDNGRDILGDDIPPDEVNIIETDKNYGWPNCYGDNVYDKDFSDNDNPEICSDLTPPHVSLQAHSAALGLAFVPEEGWPEDMSNNLLIAYHGSWNRSEPTGYKVVQIKLNGEEDRRPESEAIDFLTGFLAEGKKVDDAIGRPAGLLAEPGGILYVTDDRAGAVYRVSRIER